jgi:hypothetical protein
MVKHAASEEEDRLDQFFHERGIPELGERNYGGIVMLAFFSF